MFVVDEADESLAQNPKSLLEIMVGYFNGTTVGVCNL